MKRAFKAISSALLVSSAFATTAIAAEEVNVYSYRQSFLVEPLFDAFENDTGIKINYIFAKDGLVERLQLEGAQSPADVLMTVDIGRLTDAVAAGVTQTIDSDVVNNNIPTQFRDPEGQWVALTTRARIIVTSKERVQEGDILTYQDLADPKWQGKICTRSGKHPYMVALTASIIAKEGEEAGKNWLQGLKNNLARKPQGNDRAQVEAIKEGICDVAVINSYYIGKMLEDPEQKPWADSVNLVFPNQQGDGTHLNISGIALAKGAPNKDNAIKLIEFLSGIEAQTIYAEDNYEHPVHPDAKWSDLLNSWGKFKADDMNVAELGKYRATASKLADEVGYDL